MAVSVSHPPSSEASLYSTPHHFSLEANPHVPNTTTARRRIAAASEVERCNVFIKSRLEALRKEPPSTFHAPDGTKSLKPKHKRGPSGPRSKDRVKPTWDDGTSRPSLSTSQNISAELRKKIANSQPDAKLPDGPRTWPIKLNVVTHPTPFEQHEKNIVNKNLQRRIADQHKFNRKSPWIEDGIGRRVDGISMWAKRLAIYDPVNDDGSVVNGGKNGMKRGGGKKGIDPSTGKCVSTGVPKTLGVARCSGSGVLSYFNADGHKLKETDVKGLFYCKKWYDDFKSLDAKMQRQIVHWHASRTKVKVCDPGFTGGQTKEGVEWRPVRPQGESWTANEHMGLALRLMQRVAKGDTELTMETVKEKVQACKEKEKSTDSMKRQKQKDIDDGAAFERQAVFGLGVDGEKPDPRKKTSTRAETLRLKAQKLLGARWVDAGDDK